MGESQATTRRAVLGLGASSAGNQLPSQADMLPMPLRGPGSADLSFMFLVVRSMILDLSGVALWGGRSCAAENSAILNSLKQRGANNTLEKQELEGRNRLLVIKLGSWTMMISPRRLH